MSKAIMLSVKPEYCYSILSGEKKFELRKTKPKLDFPFKAYIYCTRVKETTRVKGWPVTIDELFRNWENKMKFGMCEPSDWPVVGYNKKVIGEFTCDRIEDVRYCYSDGIVDAYDCKATCLSACEILDYACCQRLLYKWHISNFKLYDKPRSLEEFNLKSAPQSWCYVEE